MTTAYLAPDPTTGGVPAPDVPPADPNGDGTAAHPVTRKRAVDQLSATHLLALPGVYRGEDSMCQRYVMPDGFSLAGVAEGLAQTLFDGEFLHNQPITATTGSTVHNIEACNSANGYVLSIGKSNGTVVTDCSFWNDPPPAGFDRDAHDNCHAVAVSESSSVELSGIVAFGWARKILQVHVSSNVSVNGCWFRHDGNNGNNTKCVGLYYHSGDVSMVDSVVTCRGTRNLMRDPGEQTNGALIGSDTPDPEGRPVLIRNVLVDQPEDACFRANVGLQMGSVNDAPETSLRNATIDTVNVLGSYLTRAVDLAGHEGANNSVKNLYVESTRTKIHELCWQREGVLVIGEHREFTNPLPEAVRARARRDTDWSMWEAATSEV